MKHWLPWISLFVCSWLVAQSPARVDLRVGDRPNDDGSALVLDFQANGPGDSLLVQRDDGWIVYRAPYDTTAHNLIDEHNLTPGKTIGYTASVRDSLGAVVASTTMQAAPRAQWFHHDKLPLFILLVFLCAAVVWYIFRARQGKQFYIRRINGLDSMDEAVGRATEMGKPIVFVPGIDDIDDIQTVAALTILGQLAQKTAQNDTPLLVPVSHSMVLSTAREIVKESYLKAGRPDAYNPDSVFYLTDDQFGYVAGIDGILVRERPAAVFLLGSFFAESLILAETGFAIGAIQTAGTAQQSQLPFFVVACDYTLIGEELFAASAYLSRDPHQLGSLKGQDLGKAIVGLGILVGVVLEIFNIHAFKNFFAR